MSHLDKINVIHDEHAKSVAPDDLLGQVRRTLHGKPISDDQVAMINRAISDGLKLEHDDVLLDLCCGNGMLTDPAFAQCSGGVGVDAGAYLIQTARRRFGQRANCSYVVDDVVHFAESEPSPARFTVALCYGSFQYLSESAARTLLRALSTRFSLKRLFLGNMPDRTHLSAFFDETHYTPGIENDNETLIGLWRTPEALSSLAADCGFEAQISTMPPNFYAAHYRFDALLTPRKQTTP